MQFLKKGLCALTFGMFCNEPLLKKGDKAPDFKLLDQNGAAVSLHNLLAKKKKIALVFYPRDNTTTCTKQLKKLNQNTSLLNAKNILIYAISANTPKSHLEFKAKGQFDFNFLTATEEFLTKYNASGIVLNKRKTVLINEDGFIVSIINDVIIDEHTQQIINAFGA